MIFQLMFTCATRADADHSEFDQIAESLRLRNTSLDLTGMLLFKEGSILQIVEGEQGVIKDLFDSLAKDPRISNLLPMIQRNSDKREFSNWSFGYKNANGGEASFDLTPNNFRAALPKNLSSELNTIFRTFVRVNGLA